MAYLTLDDDFRLQDFRGGLNTLDHKTRIQDNESPDCQNARSNTQGVLEKREGFAKYNANAIDSNPIHGLHGYIKSSTGDRELLIASGSKVYKGDDAGGAATEIATGLTSNLDVNFANFLDKAIFTNGTDNIKKYDGSTSSDLGGTPPKGKYLAVAGNRLWVTGNSTTPYRVWFSNIADVDTWGASDFIDFRSHPDEKVVGIAAFRERVIVFTENGLHQIANPGGSLLQDMVVQEVLHDVDCISHRSIQEVRGTLIWAGKDNVWGWDGTRLANLSRFIQPTYESHKASLRESMASIVWKNKYILSYGTSTATSINAALVFDYELPDAETGKEGAWWPDTGYGANCFAIHTPSGEDDPALFFGSSTTGRIYKLFTGDNDDGAAIDTQWKSKAFDLGKPNNRKIFRWWSAQADAVFKDYSIEVAIEFDFRPTEIYEDVNLMGELSEWDVAAWDIDAWDGAGGIQERRFSPSTGHQGRFFQVKVRNQNADEPFTLFGVTAPVKVTKWR